jgi:hypothetical protein
MGKIHFLIPLAMLSAIGQAAERRSSHETAVQVAADLNKRLREGTSGGEALAGNDNTVIVRGRLQTAMPSRDFVKDLALGACQALVRSDLPVRYRYEIIDAKGNGRFVIADKFTCQKMALPAEPLAQSLTEPATIHYLGRRPALTVKTCAEWAARLIGLPTNETWTLNHAPAKPESLYKSEYETQAQFATRGSAQAIARSAGWADVSVGMPNSDITYDAERHVMEVASDYESGVIDSSFTDGASWTGANAFGSSVRVKTTNWNSIMATFTNASLVFPRDLLMELDPVTARNVKESGNIRVLGKIRYKDSSGWQGKATLSDPHQLNHKTTEVVIDPFCVAVTVGITVLPNWQRQ